MRKMIDGCKRGAEAALTDIFRIQRGIATGSNKFFVIDRSDAKRRGLPQRFLRPMLPSPRHLKATVIDADEDGYPLIAPQLCLIDCNLPEHLVEQDHPGLWEYLQTAESQGILDRYLIGKRTPWYKQERREPAPFLCTYLGRGSNEKRPFRFIWNRSNADRHEPLSDALSQALVGRHAARASRLRGELHDLLGQIGGYELRGEGRVYGGGLHKIEPSELGRISAAAIVNRWPHLAAAPQCNKTLPFPDGF